MANKKISELNEASSLNNSDVMPVVQGNETKKSALSTLISFLNSKLSFLKSSDISTTISSSSTDSKVASEKAVYTYAPPKSHASSATTYGVGTTANYGHCRTINNLTTSSHTNGYALSAYQGYLLNRDKQAKLTAGTNITIDSNNVISASGGGGGATVYGRWVLNDNVYITPVSSYTQNLVKMVETITPDSTYFSYNATTGVWTFNKAGKYRVKLITQMRGVNSSNATLTSLTNAFVQKGFGIGDPTNLNTSYINVAQQCDLAEYMSLYTEYTWVATVGSTFCAEAYSRIQSGSIGTNKVALWGSERTSIDIELIEETSTASTNSINPAASLMNTGSLVGMGDRAELGVIGNDTNATDEISETTNTNNDSGDTI